MAVILSSKEKVPAGRRVLRAEAGWAASSAEWEEVWVPSSSRTEPRLGDLLCCVVFIFTAVCPGYRLADYAMV